MADTYTATANLYVLTQGSAENDSALQSGLNASQMIANDVASLVKTDAVARAASQELGIESLAGYDIAVSSSTTSRIVTLTVEGVDPRRAADICTAIVTVTSEVAKAKMGVEAVNILDETVEVPQVPSGPNRKMYVAVAFLAGLFLAVAIVVLIDMLNTRVRSSAEIEELLGVPIIGRFPYVKGL